MVHDFGRDGVSFGKDFLEAIIDGATIVARYPLTRWCFPTLNYPTALYATAKEMKGNLWLAYERSTALEERTSILEEICRLLQPLLDIVEEEVKLVGPQNVFIGGISAGCTAALHVFLSFQSNRYSGSLGGFIGLGGMIPFPRDIQSLIRDTPLFRPSVHEIPQASLTLGLKVVNLIRASLNLPRLGKFDYSPSCLRSPMLIGTTPNLRYNSELDAQWHTMIACLQRMGFLHPIWCNSDHDPDFASQMEGIIKFLEVAGCIKSD
ncbi:hypothetical protein DSL72_004717 [Monilinia vaccinii-corymbosi]|uniref:Phospholipase/carboxylesterase/thioesterase domain-containing protein n=1 Tax=Monilinia vaccinii-corymbosi TaxID=61207 RepID=A0A8A3P9Z6_9HELO|nr:hypothetical protein DSL72_004717 [Monilinia vaccinii-corymbosi]